MYGDWRDCIYVPMYVDEILYVPILSLHPIGPISKKCLLRPSFIYVWDVGPTI